MSPRDGTTVQMMAAVALMVSLVSLLAAGLHNVAEEFAEVKAGSPAWLHWLSALAVELGVVAISLTLTVRARAGARSRRLYVGVLLFVGVSLFANYDASLQSLVGSVITWQRIWLLDPWTLLKAGLLGGAIPVMVLVVVDALRELATLDRPGHDFAAAPAPAPIALPHVLETARAPVPGHNGHRPNSSGPTSQEAIELRALLGADPFVAATVLAKHLHVSRATVYRWGSSLGFRRSEGRWTDA